MLSWPEQEMWFDDNHVSPFVVTVNCMNHQDVQRLCFHSHCSQSQSVVYSFHRLRLNAISNTIPLFTSNYKG